MRRDLTIIESKDWFIVDGCRDTGWFSLWYYNPLNDRQDIEGYCHKIILSSSYEKNGENGRIASGDRDKIDNFGQKLCEPWEKDGVALLMAVLIHDGISQWIFRTNNVQKCKEQFTIALQEEKAYQSEFITDRHPRWNHLQDLFLQTMDWLEHQEEWKNKLKKQQIGHERRVAYEKRLIESRNPSARKERMPRKYNIDEILALPSHIDIAYHLLRELEKCDADLNDSEKAVINAMGFDSFINGDGLMEYLDTHSALLIGWSKQALSVIGAKKHLACLDDALTIFPNSVPPEDGEKYREVIFNLSEQQRKLINDMTSRYYDASNEEDICELIHQFVIGNIGDFK